MPAASVRTVCRWLRWTKHVRFLRLSRWMRAGRVVYIIVQMRLRRRSRLVFRESSVCGRAHRVFVTIVWARCRRLTLWYIEGHQPALFKSIAPLIVVVVDQFDRPISVSALKPATYYQVIRYFWISPLRCPFLVFSLFHLSKMAAKNINHSLMLSFIRLCIHRLSNTTST